MNEVAVARSAIANSYFRLWSRAARLSNDAEPGQLGAPRRDTGETDPEDERVDND
jgi:hypothetical protein